MNITQKLQSLVSTLVIIALLVPFSMTTAFAQGPGSGDGPIGPGLGSGDSPIGPVAVTNELEQARDEIWDVILEETTVGPVAQIFDGVHVPLSGIMEIEGRDTLYISVDEEYWEAHGDKELRAALQKRFPGIPIYIEGSEEGIRFLQGTTAPSPVSYNVRPNLAIPDNTDTQGTTSTITVPRDSTIDSASVTVNITHPYIGDLKVDLVTPSGTTIVLHNRTGRGTNNISKTYTTELSDLVNAPAQGNWQLRVGDYSNSDTGTLVSWTLTITPNTETSPPVTSDAIFSDDFTNGLSKWTLSGDDWESSTLDESVAIEGYTTSNIVAQADNCDASCVLTLTTGLNLSGKSSAHLSFHRFIDDQVDNGEYLKVEVSNNGGTSYRELDRWGGSNDEDDNVWHHETYQLTLADLQSTNFKVRFTSNQSTSAEDTAIDNVIVSETPVTTVNQLNCITKANQTIPLKAGDRMFVGPVGTTTTAHSCGTVTLGGVETKDGKKGFVSSAHVIDSAEYKNTNMYVGHSISSSSNTMGLPLGKVDIMPFTWRDNVVGLTGDESVILADAAFVEYPHVRTCELGWLGFCLRYAYSSQRVESKKIRGDSATYTVVGSQTPTTGLNIRAVGASTGVERSGVVRSNTMIFSVADSDVHHRIYLMTVTSPLSLAGDSGGPVYTVPGAGSLGTNEVNIVGIYVGTKVVGGQTYGVFSSWDDVEKVLNLKPLQ